MSSEQWRRIKGSEYCIVCGHRGWCLVSPDGAAVICARVESPRRAGDAGWLHRLSEPLAPKPSAPRPGGPPPDFTALAKQCAADLPDQDALADELGVSDESLGRLRLGWHRGLLCYTFPMRDARRRIIGIRTRTRSGDKRAVTGSRQGLFIPADLQPGPLWVCEGPTDTAALITLGLSAIGRPSNTGGHDLLAAVAMAWRHREVVIMADRDRPGSDAERLTMDAARKLAGAMPKKLVKIIRPPGTKDVRDLVRAGETRESLESLAGNYDYV